MFTLKNFHILGQKKKIEINNEKKDLSCHQVELGLVMNVKKYISTATASC